MHRIIGVYPGTFDPITCGHLDIISRASQVVDKLIIGVAHNANKSPLFSLEERVLMVKQDMEFLQKKSSMRSEVEVIPFNNLLIDFVIRNHAKVIIRGLRAVSDFEHEFQMASMNLRLNSQIETIFLMATDKYQFISSSMIKEVARFGGDISPFVSSHVMDKIKSIHQST